MASSNNKSAPSLDLLDGLLGFHLRVAQLRALGAFAEAVGDSSLTPLLAGTLVVIAANPEINQTDLAALLVVDPSTMVRLIDQLVKRDWVVRETATHDRRHTFPRLTAAGRTALAELNAKIAVSEELMAARLSREEREQLLTLLRRFWERPGATR